MTTEDLKIALEGLSTERIQRLADRLEREPEIEVTVKAWRPQCPMVLAGFEPLTEPANAPEQRFAAVWDRFARPERRHRLPLPWDLASTQVACRADVQRLLHQANGVLAARSARHDAPVQDASAARGAQHRPVHPRHPGQRPRRPVARV
jgi:hypothetical protein